MMALAILFGFSVLMTGSDVAAMQGRFAQQLDLTGSGVIPYVPWIALAGYVAAVFAVRKIKRTRTRWIGFVMATLIGNTVISYPVWLLNRGSIRSPVKDFISRESRAAFEKRYPVKFVNYLASYERDLYQSPQGSIFGRDG